MKTKLLILFLFFTLSACDKGEILVAQTVPDTETFSIFDVLDAVYGSHASGNLASAFTDSDPTKFDPTYGSKTMSPQTLLGFRNYGGNWIPLPPVATAATSVVCTSFAANWNASLGATGYYLSLSYYSNFSSYITGYHDLDVGNVTNYSITGLTSNTAYYYRLTAYNGNGTSYASNITNVTTLTGTTYDDWVMPSESQVNNMETNLYNNGIGGFSYAAYWFNKYPTEPSPPWTAFTYLSVTYYCANGNEGTWLFGFGYGNVVACGNSRRVRAVRVFQHVGDIYNLGDEGPAGGWISYKQNLFGTVWIYEEAAPTDQSSSISFFDAAKICADLSICH